jgi:hypothetical protein
MLVAFSLGIGHTRFVAHMAVTPLGINPDISRRVS